MKNYLFLLCLFLCACATATHEGFEQLLRAAEGHDISEVIAKYGPPASTYPLPNGNTVYTFRREYRQHVPRFSLPSTATTSVYGNTAYTTVNPGASWGGYTSQSSCMVNLTVDRNNRIILWAWEGAACVAREQR